MILKPIVDKLHTFSSKKDIESKLNKILSKRILCFTSRIWRGNLINLRQLGIDLTSYDFSHMTVTYLQDVNLHHVNFAYSDLAKSVFAETLSSAMSIAISGWNDR